MQGYRTVAAEAEAEFIEKRSRFIGHIAPVYSEEEAADYVAQMRQRYWDASHNVYAYILRTGQIRRYSDDSEPQGTAGIPTLEVISREQLTDVVVVVTRYFGGTLLGAGGLVRAYSHAAKLAVDAAQVLDMQPCTELRLELDYAQYGKISYLLPQFGAKVLDSDFGAAIQLRVLMHTEETGRFFAQLREATSDTVVPQVTAERYEDLSLL